MPGFSVSGKDIRYGLLAVKNIGRQFIDQIVVERRYKPYSSFYDFCKRNHGRNMNSRALESLIKCGALDGLGANRRQMLTMSKTVLDDLDYESKHNLNGQMSLFDMGAQEVKSSEPVVPDLPEFPEDELMRMEKEIRVSRQTEGNCCRHYRQGEHHSDQHPQADGVRDGGGSLRFG